MLALLNRTSARAGFLLCACPDTHQHLRLREDESRDKATSEEGKQGDSPTSIDGNADATTAPSALVDGVAFTVKDPRAVDLHEGRAPQEQVASLTEPSMSSATSSKCLCQTHFFAHASHITVGQFHNHARCTCAEERTSHPSQAMKLSVCMLIESA